MSDAGERHRLDRIALSGALAQITAMVSDGSLGAPQFAGNEAFAPKSCQAASGPFPDIVMVSPSKARGCAGSGRAKSEGQAYALPGSTPSSEAETL